MLRNYLKIAVRNLLRNKTFSFIRISGLALGMSVVMLVILMLADHLRYDQFHENKNRIYRILSDRENSKAPSATTPYALADALKNYPAIEETTQLTRGVAEDLTFDAETIRMRAYFADPGFFKVFSFHLQHGNPSDALEAPNSVVITADLARRIFRDNNPLGKTVGIRNPSADSAVHWGYYTISGVLAEENQKSHLQFDALVSSSSIPSLTRTGKIQDLTHDWQTYHSYTYVLLAPRKTREDLTASLTDLVAHRREELRDVRGFDLIPQLLTKITPGILVRNETSATLPLAAYYFLSALAVVILLSACLNYTNLSTARALTRAREIGVRKVTGALRMDIIFQFLSEAILTAFLALGVAVLIMLFLKSAFLQLSMNQYLRFSLEGSPYVYITFAAFALLTGLIAGFYPAVYLSKFQPVKALKNNEGSASGKSRISRMLAVCQFVISLFFITTSLLLVNQFRHFMQFDYGFNPENIINVRLQGNSYRKVANELGAVSGVAAVSACNYIPATGTNNGMRLKPAGSDQDYQQTTVLITDENFIRNLGIDLVAGENLVPTDSSNRFVLVNAAAVKAFGYGNPSAILGEVFEGEDGRDPVEVVGVVKDFFVKMPMGEDKVGPLVLRHQPHEFTYANIRITVSDLMGTVRKLEAVWKKIDPEHPFEYEFYDEQLASAQQGLFDIVSIIGFIAFMSVVIACLGLLGMSAYSSERRKKEVSIRKVLGAHEFGLALLLSKDFLKILLASIFVGAPLSYFVNNLWLQRFPNRVEFGFGTIFLATLMLLVLGLITIGSQTIKASKSNPADVLKTE